MKALVLFIIALAVAPFGLVAIVKNHPYTGTFSLMIPAGDYYYLPVQVVNGGRVSGTFIEAQGHLINLYLFNQQEFDDYKANGLSSSLFSSIDQSQGTYAASILVPGTYYVVTAPGAGYTQTSQQVTLTVRIDGTNPAYLALESLGPIAGWLGVAAFILQRREDARKVRLFLEKCPNFGPGQGEFDTQILGTARDLCQQLQLSYSPLIVYWASWLRWTGVKAAPSDLCLFGLKGPRRGYVYLPTALRGKLDPGEWTSLLASSLIWIFQPELKQRRTRLVRLWRLTILGSVAAVTAILLIFNTPISVNGPVEPFSSLAIYMIAASAVYLLLFFTARKINMILRDNILKADRLAEQILGNNRLLFTLRKIDSMKLEDLEERNREKDTIWRRAGVLPWPSMAHRIRNLERV